MAKPYVKLTEQSMMGIARPAVYEGFFLPIAKTNKKKQTNKQTLTNANGCMQSHTNLKRNTKFHHNDNFNFSLGLYHYIKFDQNQLQSSSFLVLRSRNNTCAISLCRIHPPRLSNLFGYLPAPQNITKMEIKKKKNNFQGDIVGHSSFF